MNTIIEKIRAEVNRQAKSIDTATGDFAEGRRMEQRIILSVLSDLEKEEKPMELDFERELYKHFGQVKDFTLGMRIGQYFYELGRQSKRNIEICPHSIKSKSYAMNKPKVCEGLEEEIKRFQKEVWDYDTTLSDVARHFARWGAVHIRKVTKKVGCDSEIPKDLESYAQMVENYYDVGEDRGYLCTHRGDIKNAVLAGAEWQKEQMMKEARPRFIHNVLDDNTIRKMVHLYSEEIPKEKNVVKLIIIKED